MSALTLYNLVLYSPGTELERLNRFGENRDTDTVGGKCESGHGRDEKDEDVTHSLENSEVSTHKSDGEGEEDKSQGDNPVSRGGAEANMPWHKTSSPSCHSVQHLCPHFTSWGSSVNLRAWRRVKGC